MNRVSLFEPKIRVALCGVWRRLVCADCIDQPQQDGSEAECRHVLEMVPSFTLFFFVTLYYVVSCSAMESDVCNAFPFTHD